MSKKILWVVGTFNNVGGGELLINEGAKYYRSLGHSVNIVTWDYNSHSDFDGTYPHSGIKILKKKEISREKIFDRSLDALKSLGDLRKLIINLKPDVIICQSEYDAARLYLATMFTKFKYAVLIFGQTFQFSHDNAKYSLIFKKNIKLIIETMEGYKDTVSLEPPKMSFFNKIANEIVCFIRFYAIRKSKSIFSFSKQVQWEILKLYNIRSYVVKGAYDTRILNYTCDTGKVRERYGLPLESKVFLSLSRLDPKKRIDLCIKSFEALQMEDAVLLIGGKGEDRKRLEKLASESNVAEQIKFLGYVEQKDVWDLKQMSDVFVSLDIADFDITAYEALALGTKVVWTEEADLDKDIEGYNNLFVVKPNVKAISAGMLEALRGKKIRDKNVLKSYTWDNYFAFIIDKFTAA